jgi:hypothetical protein
MPVITTRLYDTPQNAKGAVTKLKKSHVNDDQIDVVSGDGKSAADVVAAIALIGISDAHAKVYAEAVGRGATFVAVRPLFGRAAEAGDILDSFSPIPSGITEGDDHLEAKTDSKDPSAPLSAAAGWALLSSNPTPLSSYFGWSLLTKNKYAVPSLVTLDLLTKSTAFISDKFGWRLLSSEPAPLSKKFGWNLLSSDPTPLSNKYKWPLLSKDPTPLSNKLGLDVLSKA